MEYIFGDKNKRTDTTDEKYTTMKKMLDALPTFLGVIEMVLTIENPTVGMVIQMTYRKECVG